MRPVNEQDMEDLKMMLAVQAAKSGKKGHRIEAVCSFLQCEKKEARSLISRGSRLARDLAKERAA